MPPQSIMTMLHAVRKQVAIVEDCLVQMNKIDTTVLSAEQLDKHFHDLLATSTAFVRLVRQMIELLS